jgi:alanine dehydrogenase
MVIGIPRETHRTEHRVGLNPFAVSKLTRDGHAVFVESRAGEDAHFSDEDYRKAGACIAYAPEEPYRRADLLCRVGRLEINEVDLLPAGATVCGFQHLAVAPRPVIERLLDRRLTVVGYERIRDARGERPVLVPQSEMGGRLAVHIAAHYLQSGAGGRGVLLGNVPGVPPPTVVILGAGAVGRAATRQALASGAHVIVLDEDLRKLTLLSREVDDRVVTALVADGRLRHYTGIADVLIGAVHVPGERAPYVVSEEMVQSMKPGSVIVDVAIDQGGCVETSRPTTPDEPTFVRHGIVHYCVPNMTTSVARTASRVLANAALPFVLRLAAGPARALADDPGLAEGVLMWRGEVTDPILGRRLGVPAVRVIDRLTQENRA